MQHCWACNEIYEEEGKCPYCGVPREMPKPPEPEIKLKEEPKKKTLKEKLTGK